jgi:hypothetical protein
VSVSLNTPAAVSISQAPTLAAAIITATQRALTNLPLSQSAGGGFVTLLSNASVTAFSQPSFNGIS